MINFAQIRTTPSMAIVGMTAAMAAGHGEWPEKVTPSFAATHTGASYSSFEKTVSFSPSLSETKFADRIAEVYASLAEDQEPLGSEFEAVWDANAATLYEA